MPERRQWPTGRHDAYIGPARRPWRPCDAHAFPLGRGREVEREFADPVLGEAHRDGGFAEDLVGCVAQGDAEYIMLDIGPRLAHVAVRVQQAPRQRAQPSSHPERQTHLDASGSLRYHSWRRNLWHRGLFADKLKRKLAR